jgi:hypothetical protein
VLVQRDRLRTVTIAKFHNPPFKEPQQNRVGASLGDRLDGLFRDRMLGTTTANLLTTDRL